MKIYLNDELWNKKDLIDIVVDAEFMFNSAFNGASYELLHDENDCTWIEGSNEIDGTFLLGKIQEFHLEGFLNLPEKYSPMHSMSDYEMDILL